MSGKLQNGDFVPFGVRVGAMGISTALMVLCSSMCVFAASVPDKTLCNTQTGFVFYNSQLTNTISESAIGTPPSSNVTLDLKLSIIDYWRFRSYRYGHSHRGAVICFNDKYITFVAQFHSMSFGRIVGIITESKQAAMKQILLVQQGKLKIKAVFDGGTDG